MDREQEPSWDANVRSSLSSRPQDSLADRSQTDAPAHVGRAATPGMSGTSVTPGMKGLEQPPLENSIEPQSAARQLVIDGHAVTSLTFSKRRQGPHSELKVDIRATSPGVKGTLQRRDLDPQALSALVGPDNAQHIIASKQRGGTLEGDRLRPNEVPERLARVQADDRNAGLTAATSLAEKGASTASVPAEAPDLQAQIRRNKQTLAAMVVEHGRGGAGQDESPSASLARIEQRWGLYAAGQHLAAALGEPAPLASASASALEPAPASASTRVTFGVASQWADQDAKDFARLQTPELQSQAARMIAQAAQAQPDYRDRLEAKEPALFQQVQAVDAVSVRAPATTQGKARADAGEPVHSATARDQTVATGTAQGPGGASTSKSAQETDLDRRAEQALRQALLKAELAERFLHTEGEYRFRGEPAKVAFVDRGAKLTTQLASPSVARSMVDLAESKGWSSLRVRGEAGFRQQVWIEASLRDVKVVGYEPTPEDRLLLQNERAARQTNSVEVAPEREPTRGVPDGMRPAAPSAGNRESSEGPARGDAEGKRQVLAVLQAALQAQHVDQKTAVSVLRSAEERLNQMADAGQKLPRVRVYDRQAAREVPVKVPALQEQRERSARGR